MGHPPKWAPGGEMSHRMHSGKRVNAHGVRRDGVRIGNRRGKDDHRAAEERPAHASKVHTKRRAGKEGARAKSFHQPNGTTEDQVYVPPVLANPGSVVQELYTAEEVKQLLSEAGDLIDCKVGGGQMGNDIAHENEAPFPERVPEFLVRSFCPEGGIVGDCFSGSGTTAAVAVRWGRRALCCDLRQSQVDLTRRRVAGEVTMFH